MINCQPPRQPVLVTRSRVTKIFTAMAVSLFAISGTAAMAAQPTIVLIGGMKPGQPVGEHDYPDGVLKIERLIKASPDFAKLNPVVKAFPIGFPKNLAELDDASVILFYFGTDRGPNGSTNPLEDPSIKQHLTTLMDRGVGLVALHQSFTLPSKTSAAAKPFQDWLGASRVAVTDYSMEAAPLTVTAKTHPVANGVSDFNYLDEFYSAIDFAPKVNPILSARTHVQYTTGGKPVFQDPAKDRVIAWTHERANGGRAFGFGGGHYLASFDQPQVRKMVLNAILWAAKADVPQGGVNTTIPYTRQPGEPPQAQPAYRVVLRADEVKPEPQSWGMLKWFASRALGNSTKMTTGEATVAVGKANPVHWHPNTDEVLHVVSGHIMHRVGDQEYEMRAGDTVVIPEGTRHNARNIGTEDAVLAISFNSADRYTIGE